MEKLNNDAKVRHWLGTLNNPEVSAQTFLEQLYETGKVTYITGQLEEGIQGTRHIQYFCSFSQPQRMSALKKICGKTHWTPVRIDNGAAGYCNKEETRIEGPWSFGKKPLKRNNPHDWEEIKRDAQEGNLDKIPADVFVRYYNNLKRIHTDNLAPTDATKTRGLWIYGPPGTGKTHFARTQFGDSIYIKSQNKWFDGYKGQKIIILDDLDTPILAHYLKIWTDKWACMGEVKGGTVELQHEKFIVTSNFSLEELFHGEPLETQKAIARRFEVMQMTEVYKPPE